MQVEQILLGTIAAGLIVMFGGGYAGLLALGRLRDSRQLVWSAYACYAGLVVSSWMLASALALDGRWRALIPLLLFGYLVAPQAIWKLCVATHADNAASKVRSLKPEVLREAKGEGYE